MYMGHMRVCVYGAFWRFYYCKVLFFFGHTRFRARCYGCNYLGWWAAAIVRVLCYPKWVPQFLVNSELNRIVLMKINVVWLMVCLCQEI